MEKFTCLRLTNESKTKQGLTWWLSCKEPTCDAEDAGSIAGWGRSPGRKRQSTPVSLPGKSHGQKSLVGRSSWGCKEPDMTEELSRHAKTKCYPYHHNQENLKYVGKSSYLFVSCIVEHNTLKCDQSPSDINFNACMINPPMKKNS